MDKTDGAENTRPGYAKFVEMAQRFANSFGSHHRAGDGSSVTVVRGTFGGVASILTYTSKTDETELTAAK